MKKCSICETKIENGFIYNSSKETQYIKNLETQILELKKEVQNMLRRFS